MISNLARRATAVPLVLALLAPPGCVSKPVLTVHHAELHGLSAWGLSTLIFLQVRNDNSFDVQVRNVNVNVSFGRGYALAPVTFSPNQWLPAHQTTLVGVPVTLPWTMIPALISETAGSRSISYHVIGAVDVTATRSFGIQRDNYPIDEDGSISRQLVVDTARNAIPLPL